MTVRKIVSIIREVLNGVINQTTLASLADYFHSHYISDSAIRKCYIYTRNFLKYLYKVRMDARLLTFHAIFERPKVRKEIKLMTSRIITSADVANLLDHLDSDTTLTEQRKLQFKGLILFLAYSGQRQISAYRTTAGQFRQALAMKSPLVTIKAEHDKNRMEHFAPLHPVVIPYVKELIQSKSDDEIIFNIDRLEFWLAKTRIPLINCSGKWEIKDLRKFFEQKSDEIGFNDANKNFIMSHGVSSINWTSYKQFLPENVYTRYMACWGSISIDNKG